MVAAEQQVFVQRDQQAAAHGEQQPVSASGGAMQSFPCMCNCLSGGSAYETHRGQLVWLGM
jgi:hypothetical protein